MTDEKMIDASFEVRFKIPVEVRSYNDSVINQEAVVEAAKAGAREELHKQLVAALAAGDFDIGE